MYCLFLFLLSLLSLQTLTDDRLSEEAQRVQIAYMRLKKEPTSSQAQQKFVSAFPASQAVFLRVFDPADFGQLYANSNEYIQALQRVGKSYPKEVLNKCLTISKDLTWEADAIGFLQKTTVIMGTMYPRIFMQEARHFSMSEQKQLFQFLADVENHNQYSEFQLLIKRLNEVGATDLTQIMRQAKEQRMRQKRH